MFCATFVKFVVPRKEMVCRFRALSVAMNRRCFTDFMSSTTTSSAVSAKNASISDAGALFSDAMRANRSSSSNVDTTGNAGCVAARVFACSMFVAPRSFVAAVATTSAMASKPSARGLNDAPPSDLTVGGVGGVSGRQAASSTTDESSSAAFFTGRETSLSIPSRGETSSFDGRSDETARARPGASSSAAVSASEVSVSTMARGMTTRPRSPRWIASGVAVHRACVALGRPAKNRPRAANPRAQNDGSRWVDTAAGGGRAAGRVASARCATRGTAAAASRSMP